MMAQDEEKSLALLNEKRTILRFLIAKLNNISNKLNEKDRKTFLNCPWPKLVKEDWEKNNEL